MSVSTIQKNYRDVLEIILQELLPLFPPTSKKSKIIHDSLWGSRLFYPWEIAFIDTPLLQRLRRISQLGTAFLTYPSAVHNRFSHSLGVSILAGRLITRLKEKSSVEGSDLIITEKEVYTVRLAGLLHDIGHCFFSHCSEALLYEFRDECFNNLEEKESFPKPPKPHELIGYLILKSSHFHHYYNEYIKETFFSDPEKQSLLPNASEMANLIVGISPSPEKRYLQEIISGPYDVDKLEYLYRDAKMAGLSISYDIERFFYKITVSIRSDGTRRLVMEEGGVRAVEQLIFSKMMLFSFVYHHQKILATDKLIEDMLSEMLTSSDDCEFGITHPLEFLKFTDYEIMSRINKGPSERFRAIRDRLIARNIPKRCFSLNREFIKDIQGDETAGLNWDRLKEDAKKPNKALEIRDKIVQKINQNRPDRPVDIGCIYLNIPKPPKLKESVQAPILGPDGEIKGMEEFQKIEGWQKTYELKKFRGYFYSDEDITQEAAEAVSSILYEEYGLNFEDIAFHEAKLKPPKSLNDTAAPTPG